MDFPVCEPLIPFALWLSLVLAAALLLGIYGIDLARRLGARAGWSQIARMAVALALPLGILLNPTWHELVPPPEGKPQVTLLVDASASMATPDAAGSTRRWDEARLTAKRFAGQLSRECDVRLATFAGQIQSVDAAQLDGFEPQGEMTDLAAALAQTLAVDKPQGQAVVLLSDGVHNADGGEAAVVEVASRAKVLSSPIYTRTIGGDTQVRDLVVQLPTPQDLAFVGQRIPLRVQLIPHGHAAGTTQVAVSLDGDEVERREVTFAGDRMSEVEFLLHNERPGIYRYDVHATPLAGEVTESNNSRIYVLRVVNEPIRVLLLEGKPYWDAKFLLRTLAADGSLEIVSLTRFADDRFLERTLKRPADNADAAPADADAAPADASQTAAAAGTPKAAGTATANGAANTDSAANSEGAANADAAPNAKPRIQSWRIVTSAAQALAGEGRLQSYQVVVLGRDADVYLSDDWIAQLKQWLARDGGSLVCFRGTPTVHVSQRLGALLPVKAASQPRESRFHLKFTEVGRELRWLPVDQAGGDPLSRLPSLATRDGEPQSQPLSVVWAVGQSSAGGESPAVTSMPYGTGRVVVLEGAGMWRWAFLPPQYQQHERVYGALWQSLTRWLVSSTGLLPTQSYALRADKVSFDTREPATASLLVRETALSADPIEIELAGGDLAAPRKLAPMAVGDEPGVFRVVFGPLPIGRYQAQVVGRPAEDSAARTVFDVGKNVDEVVQVAANPRLMARIAEQSGAVGLASSEPDELVGHLREHLARTHPEQSRVTTAWDRWWVLLGVFAVWSVVWALRRGQGLV